MYLEVVFEHKCCLFVGVMRIALFQVITLCNNPQERSSQLLHGRSLKSRTVSVRLLVIQQSGAYLTAHCTPRFLHNFPIKMLGNLINTVRILSSIECGLDMQLFMASLYLWFYFVHRKLLHHHHGCCSVGLLG